MKNFIEAMKIWLLLIGFGQTASGSDLAVFVSEPISDKVIVGGTIRLSCQISGIPASEREKSVQWSQNNFALGFPPLRLQRFEQSSGENGDYSLEIENAQLEDSGEYECQAHTQNSRLRSKIARIQVIQPPQEVDLVPISEYSPVSESGVISVIEGVETKLQCVASASKPKTQIDWIFQDSILNGSESVTGEKTKTTVSETLLTATWADHGRQIICRADHEALNAPIERTLTLNVKTKPTVAVELSAATYLEGDTITAKCAAESNPPTSGFKWKIGNQILEGEISENLILQNSLRHLNGKEITCIAQNEIGQGSSSQLLDIQYAPDLLGPINDRLVVNISDSAVLSCNFDGNPLPRITWRLRDHDESFSRNSRGRIHVQHDGSLLIENVKQDDVGAYTCLGESELGIAENTVSLRVRGPPIITSPSDQFGEIFECGFVSEPPIESMEIIDMDVEDQAQAVIHRVSSNELESNFVQFTPGPGRYECRATNQRGTKSKFIVLHPQGMSTESRIAIVVSFLILIIIFVILIIIRMKFYPREQRFKVAKSMDGDEESGRDMGESKRTSLILGYAADAIQVQSAIQTTQQPNHAARRVSDDLITASERSQLIIKPTGGLKHHQTEASSERSHSGNDDGYGTESGSAHKGTDHSSETNSDYEINVPTVEEIQYSGSEYSKIRINPIKVDNSSLSKDSEVDPGLIGTTYQPQNIRNQTEKIQYQNYILTSKNPLNRIRSVSHV